MFAEYREQSKMMVWVCNLRQCLYYRRCLQLASWHGAASVHTHKPPLPCKTVWLCSAFLLGMVPDPHCQGRNCLGKMLPGPGESYSGTIPMTQQYRWSTSGPRNAPWHCLICMGQTEPEYLKSDTRWTCICLPHSTSINALSSQIFSFQGTAQSKTNPPSWCLGMPNYILLICKWMSCLTIWQFTDNTVIDWSCRTQ